MKTFLTRRTRALATAGVVATIALAAAAGSASATTEPPATEPPATEPAMSDASTAPDASAAPGVGEPTGVLAETTYAFADGEYHWSSEQGIVPRSIGDFEFAAGGTTLVTATAGVVAVTGADGTPIEVADGTAVVRAEDDTTVVGSADGAFGAFTSVDLEAGAAPDGGASFTPGSGERVVTLTSAVVEPGSSLDLSTLGADFAYVVVVKGIVDGSDGTELLPHGALAWTADAGPVTVGPRSPNVAAELLVVAVAPA